MDSASSVPASSHYERAMARAIKQATDAMSTDCMDEAEPQQPWQWEDTVGDVTLSLQREKQDGFRLSGIVHGSAAAWKAILMESTETQRWEAYHCANKHVIVVFGHCLQVDPLTLYSVRGIYNELDVPSDKIHRIVYTTPPEVGKVHGHESQAVVLEGTLSVWLCPYGPDDNKCEILVLGWPTFPAMSTVQRLWQFGLRGPSYALGNRFREFFLQRGVQLYKTK